MNNTRPIFTINPTPTLPTRGCRAFARILGWTLQYGNYLVAAFIWWQSDWFIAIGTLLLGFVVFGIIRSKLRNSSIPPAQREYPYDDYAIATWYLSRNHCFQLPSEHSITKPHDGECEICEDDGNGCGTCADQK